jgi:undecaprenyl-diphosphatase
MTPLLVTLLIAAGAGAATYGVLSLLQRHTDEVITDPEDAGADADSTPARLVSGTVALAALVLAGTVLGALARQVERETAVVRWDENVEQWATDSAGTVSTAILRAITHLGDTAVVLGLTGAAVVALLIIRRRRLAVFTALVVMGQWALANLIKELVGRARPDLDPLAAFSGFSFPSGHATAAAATYLALALVVAAVRPSWDARITIASGVGVAVAVAASRSLLGVHWFSDVLGGLMLGWAWCLVCAWLLRVVRHRTTQDAAFAISG